MAVIASVVNQRLKDFELRQKVADFCVKEDDVLIRGEVPTIQCPHCSDFKFDDGTYCSNCGHYSHPENIPVAKGSRCRVCTRPAKQYVYGYLTCEEVDCHAAAKIHVATKASDKRTQ